MNILEWIRRLLECEGQPEQVDFEGLEEALLELRQRLELRGHDAEPNLADMGDLLAGLCDDLDDFLDSEDFAHLRSAAEKAQEMVDIQASLQYEARLEPGQSA